MARAPGPTAPLMGAAPARQVPLVPALPARPRAAPPAPAALRRRLLRPRRALPADDRAGDQLVTAAPVTRQRR